MKNWLKTIRMSPVTLSCIMLGLGMLMSGCFLGGKAKRGCPANDRSLGAERVLAGEGKKKPSKFRVRDMNKSYSQ